jgi:hypothetical protein
MARRASVSEIYSDLFKPTVYVLLSTMGTCSATEYIHEAGHASACISLGGNVGGFWMWLKDASHGGTNCSLKPYSPIVWAGGDIATFLGWFIITLTVALLLTGGIIKRGFWPSLAWAAWSFWYFLTLIRELYHSYSPPSVWQDTTQFVHVTGINANVVGLPLAAIIILSLWISGSIQYRLLPETVTWNRLYTWLFIAQS